jgi:hypothetical protein
MTSNKLTRQKARKNKLAAALKSNLKKRKDQAKAKVLPPPTERQ